jgi:hypothetical protein
MWGMIKDPRIRARFDAHLADCRTAITDATYEVVKDLGKNDPDPRVRARCALVLEFTPRLTVPLHVRRATEHERQTALRRGDVFDATPMEEALTAKHAHVPIIAVDPESLRFWGADAIALPAATLDPRARPPKGRQPRAAPHLMILDGGLPPDGGPASPSSPEAGPEDSRRSLHG